MEKTITTEHLPVPEPGIVLTAEAQYFLSDGAGWAKFLGIIGFVCCGLMILLGLTIGSVMSYLARLSPAPNPMAAAGSSFVTVFQFLYALLYFFPSYYLFTFGAKAKKALHFGGSEELTLAIKNLKSCFKFWGILFIVMLSFAVLAIIGIVLGVGIGGLHK